ncbi:sensor histidine kinase [Micrococcus sp.]|uniref:sensor histidine kinase n=1 Tax=Micrococcus sp. TaxID=1271 RepID=UPI002A90A099|nr:histidine kinase [Micrococcus sp.]MDY6055265.1 histidine kinase [Micrococcus sp.]
MSTPASDPAGAAGPRPSGQLPTQPPVSAAGTAPGRSPALRAAWWYTAGGLLLVVVLATGWMPLVLVLDGARAEPAAELSPALRAVATVLSAACAAGASWAVLTLRDLPLHPTSWPRPPFLAALLGPPLLLAGAGVLLAPMVGLTPWCVLPLWLAVVLLVCLVPEADRRAVLTLGAVAVVGCAVATMVRTPAGPADSAFGVLFWLLMMVLTVPPTVWFWRLTLRLEDARRQAGDLAVTQERLRFAADLHDVQGHHLQVIALKAELAERLLDRGRTEEAAAALAEVRGTAAEALGETRALVRDLRAVSLADELANAADVLAAAGAAVDVRVDPGADRIPGEAGRVLGLAVREATTNILRHARAEHVGLRLEGCGPDAVRLTVRNDGADGAGGVEGGGGGPGGAGATRGSGLASLAERARALGGSAEGARQDAEFTLTITVPHGAAGQEGR